MKTYVATPADRERNWVLVDAQGQTLGRLATQIADVLRGKRKPTYTPHCDVGDFVVVINAEQISVTGNKRAEKLYHRHSGYPGGLKSSTLEQMLDRRPEEVLRRYGGPTHVTELGSRPSSNSRLDAKHEPQERAYWIRF